MMTTRCLLAALVCLPAAGALAQSPPDAGPPKWLKTHMEAMVRDGGSWVADNAAYRNEQEPAAAYGMTWTFGVGEHSMKGRLYEVKDGKPATTFWEMRVFWNPKTRKIAIHQYGLHGALLIGEITRQTVGVQRAESEIIGPDGSVSRFADEHEDVGRDLFHSRSYGFDAKEKVWKLSRRYTWKRAPVGR